MLFALYNLSSFQKYCNLFAFLELLFTDVLYLHYRETDTPKKSKKKEKPKPKHKKSERAPKLTNIDLDKTLEVVECQLDTSKHSTVTFKFNKDDDQPVDIAQTLVSVPLGLILHRHW